jgi:hypothetical protein
MRPHLRRAACAALAILFSAVVAVQAQDGECLTLGDLQRMSPCELEALFRAAEVGTPLCGAGYGRLLYSTGGRHPWLTLHLSNVVWRGKVATPDGHFVNRWLGGIRAIDSWYTIGPSWVDGRPAVVMEYPPGTPLLENTHDELREVAPGLYLGPLYDRFPCPRLRGYLVVQVSPCGHGLLHLR